MIRETLTDDERVVITGLGAVTPLGLDVPTTWANLKAGQSGISRISAIKGYPINDEVDIAGMIKGFNPEAYLHPTNIRKTHTSHQYGYAATVEAGIDARMLEGIPQPQKNRDSSLLIDLDPQRVGVIMATGIGGTNHVAEVEDLELLEAAKKFSLRLTETDKLQDFNIDNLPADFAERVFRGVLNEAGRRLSKRSPYPVLKILPERTAAIISLMLGTEGDLYTPIAACASGVRALSEAYKTIRAGDADQIFAGASESSIDPVSILSFQLIRALSTKNEEPDKASRPFDLDSDGFVMSEGAAVMVVERLSSARKRNAKIYAEILGYGNTSDAYHETAPHPEGRGAIRSMLQALGKAGIEPEAIDFLNAHATSTGEPDGKELDAYKVVFGEDLIPGIPITALKDRIGHMMGASGAIETVLSILTMRDSFIPGMMNLKRPRREGFDLVTKGRTQQVKRVLKNSFGFGGINASVILERWEE